MAGNARRVRAWRLAGACQEGARDPTELTYQQALEGALCHGWIDGQVGRRDDVTYRQRFTPRRLRSAWSQNNVTLAERLIAEGRMKAAGRRQVDSAREDGRWQAAYSGSASIDVPQDLAAALARNPKARAMFESLTRQNRYAILYRLGTAKLTETRARRIEQFVAMLVRGDTIYPQR
jgi:uncharacterized protein YdeI (YjbR/CyaY-like superfamily)